MSKNLPNKLEGLNLYFIGLGLSNIAAIRKLAKKNNVYVYDDHIQEYEDFNFIHYDEINYEKLDLIILTPGIPLKYPRPHSIISYAEEYDISIIGDIELFFLQFESKPEIIAITGTNGKSTTASLIYHLFKSQNINCYLGGNIGVAIFDLPIDENAKYIIEISSFQLDLLNDLEFSKSILLNITADHIDRHKDFNGYAIAKTRIFQDNMQENEAIICIDSNITHNIFDKIENKKYSFHSDDLERKNNMVFYKDEKILDNFLDIQKFGNPQNIIATLILAKLYGLKNTDINLAFSDFKALDHRFEKLLNYKNITIYNDSKATNAESTENALKQLDNIYWIAGGIAKSGGIELLSKYFDKVDKVFLYGQDAELFNKQIGGRIDSMIFTQEFAKVITTSIETALKAEEEINIIFSPACASFDMFKNYEERGNEFKKIINQFFSGK